MTNINPDPLPNLSNESKTIVITKILYNQLVRDSSFLQALEEAGVDNWGGYDEAYRSHKENSNA